jgi:outer membrane protein
VGGGVAYNIVFKSTDGFISNLDIKNSFGSVLQVGFEVPLEGGWSIGLDARKIFLKAKATGTVPAFGGAPVNADIKLNPLVLFASVGKQF